MRRAHLDWRLSRPKEPEAKTRDTYTQLHMLREPGLLRSVLVTALDLAHVHAAPANSALFLPEVSLFAFVFLGAELRRRACCVLRRRNLAHGSGRSVSKKQNINALYATVYLMCARAHCVTACGSTRCARATEVSDRRLLRNRRRNLAHGSGRSVSKKQNINALYATV